jgi:hypothetical protein
MQNREHRMQKTECRSFEFLVLSFELREVIIAVQATAKR